MIKICFSGKKSTGTEILHCPGTTGPNQTTSDHRWSALRLDRRRTRSRIGDATCRERKTRLNFDIKLQNGTEN